MGTKGHWQRPTTIDEAERERRWRQTFGSGEEAAKRRATGGSGEQLSEVASKGDASA